MKKKNLFAAMTALCCTAAMTLNAGAYSIMFNREFDLDTISEHFDLGLTSDEGGYLVNRSIRCHKGFVIIADDSGLPEEALQSIPNYTTHQTIVWDEDEAERQEGAATFELGTILYYVTVSEWDSLVNNARQFAMEHATVEDILFIQEIQDGDANVYDNLRITFAEGVTPTEEQFPELTDFTTSNDGANWSAYPAGEYAEEFYSMFDEGSTYAEYAWLCDFVAMLEEKYGDTHITSIDILYHGNWALYLHYNATSIWHDFGQLNGDDTVDASDAADILGFAAKSGSGDGEAAICAAASDLTMDGVTDASDAAKLLEYAAYAGTNEGATLQGFLMNE